MTRTELIAEITTDFKQYDEVGLIDYRSLNRWIKGELKRFGNNIMVATDKTLIVENGRADLPEDFWKLTLAAKCDYAGYEVVEGKKEHIIMSHFWHTRTENTYIWNNRSEEYKHKDYQIIREKVSFEGGTLECYYVNPTILKLTKGMSKEVCHSSCKNLQAALTHSAKHEINILGNTIQTNFREGSIYIQYFALPTDDTGDLIIPETQHGHLEKYLEYYCKTKILENLIGNEDDPQKRTDLGYFNAKANETFALAMTEAKFSGLGHDWDVKLKNEMRRDTLKYERMFPNK